MNSPISGDDGSPEADSAAEDAASPFRQPTASEQRAGLGCVVAAIVAIFLLIVIGILIGLT